MANLTTQDVFRDLRGRTNIKHIKYDKHDKHDNNISTIKHDNNISTIKDYASGTNHQEVIPSSPLASSLAETLSPASQPLGVALASQSAPPWKYLKADLFDNATMAQLAKNKQSLNLKLSLLSKRTSEYQYLSASLNTPFRNVKRGFDFSVPEDLTHYNLIETVYHKMSKLGYERIHASKCYLPVKKGKGASLYGMSVVLGRNPQTDDYHLSFLHKTGIYELVLSNLGLSEKQRQSNCIASAAQGEMQRPRMTPDEFFGL